MLALGAYQHLLLCPLRHRAVVEFDVARFVEMAAHLQVITRV